MKKIYLLSCLFLLLGCSSTSSEQVESKQNEQEFFPTSFLEYSPSPVSQTMVKELSEDENGSSYNLDLLTQQLRRDFVSSGAQVTSIRHRVQVVIPGKVLFGSNKKTIKSDFTKTLSALAKTLNEYPQTMIKVVGYMGNGLSVLKSQSVSLEQAQVVVNYLKTQGVESRRLLAEGKGQEDPLANNQTAEGRAKNYRVEIHIFNLL